MAKQASMELVAQKHNRHWLGCDVNAETVALANERTRYHGDDKRMISEQAAGVRQLDMFAELAVGDDGETIRNTHAILKSG